MGDSSYVKMWVRGDVGQGRWFASVDSLSLPESLLLFTVSECFECSDIR